MWLTDIGKNVDGIFSRRKLLRGVATSSVFRGIIGLGEVREQTGASDSNQYIVGTKSSGSTHAAKIHAHSIDHILQLESDKQAVAGRFSRQAIEALERRPDVRYIERDGKYRGGGQTLPWGVDRIDANKTSNAGFTGSGAHIAVIDSGIDKNHPDLQAYLGTGKSFVPNTNSWDDDTGHGTHCAGIAAANDNLQGIIGAAPALKLHAGKVLNSDNWGRWSWIAAGIQWAADQGYNVASMSIAGDDYSQTVADACKYAHDKGVLLVACAGNNYHGPVTYPGAYPQVIAVSSTTKSDTLSEFSSVGSEVELAAPGSEIYSTLPGGYGYKSGTSMACPHVSGVAGLLMSPEGGSLSHTQARQHLRDTAEDIGLSEDKQGFGLVDAVAAKETPSIGEVDRVSSNQSSPGTWHTISFEGSYANPVVIMTPGSYNGTQPCHVRIRNVTKSSFEYKLEEWDYLDGSHTTEEFSYLVMEAGSHILEDGTHVEVHQVNGVNQTFEFVNFPQSFNRKPIVLGQAQTFNGPNAIVTRLKNIGTNGFDVRLQEEETKGSHTGERVGYIAIDHGRGRNGAKIFEAKRISNCTNTWKSTKLTRKYGVNPIFLANIQTFNGSDTAGVRCRNVGRDSVEIRIEEEKSGDTETNHISEQVGYFALRGRGLF
ncbi:S8 family serine peptidase [Haladaptatus sp. NG-WS-4]